jgi:hypothetical protein
VSRVQSGSLIAIVIAIVVILTIAGAFYLLH